MTRAQWLDTLFPRFITREFAMKQVGYSSLHEIVCRLDGVQPGDRFDGIATISSFTMFGLGFFPRQIGPVRPWKNPHDRRRTA